jgi:hypothetical protein
VKTWQNDIFKSITHIYQTKMDKTDNDWTIPDIFGQTQTKPVSGGQMQTLSVVRWTNAGIDRQTWANPDNAGQ